MVDGKEALRLLIAQVGRKLGRSISEIESIQTRLIDEEWFDSVDSLRCLSDEDWKQLNLPVRFVTALKLALDLSKKSFNQTSDQPQSSNLPSRDEVETETSRNQNVSVEDEVQNSLVENEVQKVMVMNDGVSYEPADPNREEWATASLSMILRTLIGSCDRERASACLLTLHKIIQALLMAPHDVTKRRIRLGNPAFHRRVGSILEGLQFLEAVGFKSENCQDDGEMYFVIPTLYISRLSDAEALLSKALQQSGAASVNTLSQKIHKPAFNPYRSNVSTSRSDADRLAGMVAEDRDPNILRKRIKQAKLLRAKGGHDNPVPLDKVLFPPGVKPPTFPDAHRLDFDNDGSSIPGPAMTAQQLARLSEVLSGKTQFRSSLKDELDQLNAQPIFEKTTLRIYAPDKSILQVSFRNDTKVSDVIKTLFVEAFSSEFSSCLKGIKGATIWLFEAPPVRVLKDDETLYEQGMTPNGSLRLGCSAPFRGPFFRAY